MPPNACRVCDSPDLAQIDRLLADGRSQRSLAQRFGLAKDSVRRHVAGQHSATGLPDENPHDDGLGEDATPAAMMREALKRLRQVDLRRMSPNTVVQHAEAIRKISESLAKIEIDPRRVVQMGVQDVVGLPEFIAVLFRTLEVVACDACGHPNGPDLRERLALEMEAAGLEMEVTA